MLRQNSRPEIKTVDILPIVHCFIGVLCRLCYARSEMYSELSNERESRGVPDIGIQTP